MGGLHVASSAGHTITCAVHEANLTMSAAGIGGMAVASA